MKQSYTITIYAEDQIGLLARITIIFSRRKINIDSLNTSASEIPGIHRFTILINETEEAVRKLCRHIEKQVEVLNAYYHTDQETVWQEMALFKVPTKQVTEKIVIERLLREYGARVLAIREDITVFETTGHKEETDKLIKVFENYGLTEFVRGARIAIIKKNEGFHKKIQEFEDQEPRVAVQTTKF